MPGNRFFATLVAAIFSLVFWSFVSAQPGTGVATNSNFPDAPIPRLELGHHSALPLAMDVDPTSTYLVSASIDKTVRVWLLPKENAANRLEQIAVLRPPIAGGQVGEIQSVAISPDSKVVAAGGVSSIGERDERIYIFDRQNGDLITTIKVQAPVNSLAFSPDGHRLAVGLRDTAGIRVFSRSNDYYSSWQSIPVGPSGKPYGDSVQDVAFSKSGSLATISRDGGIRFYDADMVLTAYSPLPRSRDVRCSGERAKKCNLPHSVKFSPDAKFLAIGFSENTSVWVVNTTQLAEQFELQSAKLGNDFEDKTKVWYHNFREVTWSANGKYLYAAGNYPIVAGINCNSQVSDDCVHYNGTRIVRRWEMGPSGQPRGVPSDFKKLENRDTIRALAPLGESDVLVLSGDRIIGGYSSAGEMLFKHAGPHRHFSMPVTERPEEFRKNMETFRISDDGKVVEFLDPNSDKPENNGPIVRFELDGFQIEDRKSSDPKLNFPVLLAQGMRVLLENKTASIERNGKQIQIKTEKDESVRSAALSRDGKYLAVGTQGPVNCIRWFNADTTDGTSKCWETASIVWRVVVSPDHRLVVAALDDGTIRWFNTDTKQELLALYLKPWPKQSDELDPTQAFIAWTPAGFFNEQGNADKFLGWHFNQGEGKEALFYGVRSLPSKYRDRDKIKSSLSSTIHQLSGGDIGAMRKAFPPFVKILDVGRESSQVTVNLRVDSPSMIQARSLEIRMNKTVRETIPSPTIGEQYKITIKTKAGEIPETIGAALYSSSTVREVTWSEPAIRFVPARPFALETKKVNGKLYALVVGINDYLHPQGLTQIKFAVDDAEQIGKELEYQKANYYNGGNVIVLKNSDATKERIGIELTKLTEAVTAAAAAPDDLALVFFAGHGIQIADQKDAFFILARDSKVGDSNTMIDSLSLAGFVNRSYARNKLIILDACHSGKYISDISPSLVALENVSGGAAVWSSTNSSQLAAELESRKHGALAFALLEAMRGHRQVPSGQERQPIALNELEAWIHRRIPELFKEEESRNPHLEKHDQTPFTRYTGVDDPKLFLPKAPSIAKVQTPAKTKFVQQ